MTDKTITNEKMTKDKFTISISPELHSALMLASIDKDISLSKIIEYYLKNSNKFKKYIKEAKNYAKAEEGINPAAIGSDYIQKHIQDLKHQKR